MLLNFSESAEHIALTRPLWIGGVSVTNPAGASLTETLKGPDDGRLVLPGMDDGVLYDPSDLDLTSDDPDDFVLQPVLDQVDAFTDELPLPGLSVDVIAGTPWTERLMVALDTALFDPAYHTGRHLPQHQDWMT